ncbi:MAG TPA: glutamine-hydrolyzing GMP synthase [Candidatus Latescibacteria bacterium]|nr:glutamine-hydrolyzing GMP synthase [Candidatus Latescibacterota bacterium]
MNVPVQERIVVLDFGGQYAHLIANRVRRLRVFSEIMLPSEPPANLEGVRGLILSGGPSSVHSPDQPPFDARWLHTGLPVLGLCYGHQLLAKELGGEVRRGDRQEYGIAELRITDHGAIFEGLDPVERVWMSHGDSVTRVPDGFAVLGGTADCPIAAMGDVQRRMFGFQFHPEVTHSPHGQKMLDNFLSLCGCARTWTMEQFITQAEERIRRQAGDRNVFMLVSGGVDSSVAFVLLSRALGEHRVIGLHIDNGFMRLNESVLVKESLECAGFHNLHVVDASEKFLGAVKGVTDPQQKRQIVGDTFISVQQEELERIGLDPDHWMLGQGTLYPDIIESGGTRHASVIKTHHNRVAIIRQMLEEGKIIEPLDQLYKDEVRQVGRQLGLPDALVERHPFPGPGLSVRCLCSDGVEEPIEASAKEKVRALAGSLGFESEILPVRSVGVQGDERTYRHPVALWRPDGGAVNWEELERLSTRITNTVPEVNRVMLLVYPRSLPRLKLRARFLDRPRLDLLRLADHAAMSVLVEDGLAGDFFQFPTILIPLGEREEGESVVLRPLESTDVMTASFAILPERSLRRLVSRLAALPVVDAVFYDITHKPPATMEWE